MENNKLTKSEEDKKLEELLKQGKYSDEQVKKILDNKVNGTRIIPEEWEGLMGMFGERG